MHSGKRWRSVLCSMQYILVKSDEFENSYPFYMFSLNTDYADVRSLHSLRNNARYCWNQLFPTALSSRSQRAWISSSRLAFLQPGKRFKIKKSSRRIRIWAFETAPGYSFCRRIHAFGKQKGSNKCQFMQVFRCTNQKQHGGHRFLRY